MRLGCWMVMIVVAAAITAAVFYLDDQVLKATFWLIIAIASLSIFWVVNRDRNVAAKLDAIERAIRETAEEIRVTVRSATQR